MTSQNKPHKIDPMLIIPHYMRLNGEEHDGWSNIAPAF